MGLTPGRVYLWDQKLNIPSDDGLYIAVGVLMVKPFSNNVVNNSNLVGFEEAQSVNVMATLSIDILSRGPSARDRKEEIIMALRSNFATQVQEKQGFYIAGISSAFTNLSEIEGAAIPYRFNISVNIQYFIVKKKQIDYYDTYSKDVITEA
jgi:hypothetical protein